ncbi:hypothetical protein M3Y97_00001800 [Aphelenchoides bicaudatus]|nr:hypothetical protein M3Y97_00001800 [Aphelenchoides bicaudatus]
MYNKIGDNSLINLLSILSGKVYESKVRDLDNLVRDEMSLKLNETRSDQAQELADMLLLTAKKRGYATMFHDDIMRHDLGLMQYSGWKGFRKPPADYYFRPYFNYLYRKVMPNGTCLNGELYSTRFINTFERFSTVYAKQAHFSFNFITKLTHDSPSPLQLIDTPLSESFERLKQNGLFDNTVVILMITPAALKKGHRSFSIYIPKKYRLAYPEKYKNLQLNTNRLTSNFDIHETLREVMQLPSKNVGTSLFETISTQRHCEHARIPPNFCMCMEALNPSILPTEDKDFMTIMIADQFNQEINATTCISDITDLRPLAFQPYTINPASTERKSVISRFQEIHLKAQESKSGRQRNV